MRGIGVDESELVSRDRLFSGLPEVSEEINLLEDSIRFPMMKSNT